MRARAGSIDWTSAAAPRKRGTRKARPARSATATATPPIRAYRGPETAPPEDEEKTRDGRAAPRAARLGWTAGGEPRSAARRNGVPRQGLETDPSAAWRPVASRGGGQPASPEPYREGASGLPLSAASARPARARRGRPRLRWRRRLGLRGRRRRGRRRCRQVERRQRHGAFEGGSGAEAPWARRRARPPRTKSAPAPRPAAAGAAAGAPAARSSAMKNASSA